MRKAVPPPTMWDFVLRVVGAGRGQLIRVKPGGVALRSSALVEEEVIQVSVRAKRSMRRESIESLFVQLNSFVRIEGKID